MRRVLAAVLLLAALSLVLSASGLTGAAARLLSGHKKARPHPVVHHAPVLKASSRPRPHELLLLGSNAKFPASAIPTVANADQLSGQPLNQIVSTCPPATVDLGTWCLDVAIFPVPGTQAGMNNYFYASNACAHQGGYLPSATQLIGAADRVKLLSVLTDSANNATIDEDPSDGLKDQREMSATLVTTASGSSAAGSAGVSDSATGDPRSGQPNPTPQPANPDPETLQYVTVYDNHGKGGFAGSAPVGAPENFRCAFNKAPATTTAP